MAAISLKAHGLGPVCPADLMLENCLVKRPTWEILDLSQPAWAIKVIKVIALLVLVL